MNPVRLARPAVAGALLLALGSGVTPAQKTYERDVSREQGRRSWNRSWLPSSTRIWEWSTTPTCTPCSPTR